MQRFFSTLVFSLAFLCVLPAHAKQRIAVGNTLLMEVYAEPELRTLAPVATDGTFSAPLIGPMRVAGYTLKEAREALTEAYNANYLVEPSVQLSIVPGGLNIAPAPVQAAPAPASVQRPEGLQAPTRPAQPLNIQNNNAANNAANEANAASAVAETAANAQPAQPAQPVNAGEPTVPVAQEVVVEGSVARPGIVGIPAGQRGLTLMAALSRAGGLARNANANKAEIRRGGEVIEINVRNLLRNPRAKDPKLQPGDVVFIPKR